MKTPLVSRKIRPYLLNPYESEGGTWPGGGVGWIAETEKPRKSDIWTSKSVFSVHPWTQKPLWQGVQKKGGHLWSSFLRCEILQILITPYIYILYTIYIYVLYTFIGVQYCHAVMLWSIRQTDEPTHNLQVAARSARRRRAAAVSLYSAALVTCAWPEITKREKKTTLFGGDMIWGHFLFTSIFLEDSS